MNQSSSSLTFPAKARGKEWDDHMHMVWVYHVVRNGHPDPRNGYHILAIVHRVG